MRGRRPSPLDDSGGRRARGEKWVTLFSLSQRLADVAELVDAHGSGPCGGDSVEVRVLSSASCDVSGHPGHMCRDILDSRPAAERLVDAAGVERELADQLTVRIDHADVLVGDQK